MIRAYFVDDEPPAIKSHIELAKQLSTEFPIEILGSSTSATKAIEEINVLYPNVLFLDIEMPEYDGFSLLEELKIEDFLVVFVTAYRDYAAQAFEVDAFHYLVKPISPKAFRKCIVKLTDRLIKDAKINKQGEEYEVEDNKLAIFSQSGYQIIDFNNVLFIKSDGSYSNFHLKNGTKQTFSKNLRYTFELLPKNRFKRISRSSVINTSEIVSFNLNDGASITLPEQHELFIGTTYKDEVTEYLKKRFIK